jgi:hypothetical protein
MTGSDPFAAEVVACFGLSRLLGLFIGAELQFKATIKELTKTANSPRWDPAFLNERPLRVNLLPIACGASVNRLRQNIEIP